MYDPFSLQVWKSLPPSTLHADSDGCVLLTLPDDFHTLLSLRLSSWGRPVREVLMPDHWLHRLQSPRWGALRGTPERPLAFFTIDGEGHRALQLFSAVPDAPVDLVEFKYYSLPTE